MGGNHLGTIENLNRLLSHQVILHSTFSFNIERY